MFFLLEEIPYHSAISFERITYNLIEDYNTWFSIEGDNFFMEKKPFSIKKIESKTL